MHFEHAVTKLIEFEGGYVNDPRDPGGETKYGISRRSYPKLDIRNLTVEQAKQIYRRDYWDKANLDMLVDRDLATEMLKLTANIGITRAVKLLQETVNSLGGLTAVDGILGPDTALAANEYPHHEVLLMRLKLNIIDWYVRHSKPVYLRGLIRRVLGG